jgi:hypothetical protein
VVKDVAAAPALKGRQPCTCREYEDEVEEGGENDKGVSKQAFYVMRCIVATLHFLHHTTT